MRQLSERIVVLDSSTRCGAPRRGRTRALPGGLDRRKVGNSARASALQLARQRGGAGYCSKDSVLMAEELEPTGWSV